MYSHMNADPDETLTYMYVDTKQELISFPNQAIPRYNIWTVYIRCTLHSLDFVLYGPETLPAHAYRLKD